MTYLIEYMGYWGLLVIMMPAILAYGYGLNHFKKLEMAAGRYPQKGLQSLSPLPDGVLT